MIELNDKVKRALLKINFIERYELLSKTYSSERTPKDKRLFYIDKEEVIDTIYDLGYGSKFDRKEKFFQLNEESFDKYSFGFHIILVLGMVDFVWIVKEKDELLLGAPWGTYSRRLIAPDYRIKKPIIRDYEELEEILKVAFKMYEDFKQALCS